MEGKELMKIIYEDDQKTKLIKGYIISEDEFVYNIKAFQTHDKIIIGKRAVIKISPLEDQNAY